MSSRLRIGITGLGVLTLLSGFLVPERASAQVGDAHRLMLLNLQPRNDGSDRFGRDVANQLRRLLDQLPTHEPIDARELRDVARQYDIDERTLGCVQGQQMARFVDAQVIFCGNTIQNEDGTFTTTGVQFSAPGGSTLSIEDRTWNRRAAREAATFFSEQLAAFTEQQNRATFCGMYYEAQDYASAEENCRIALELDPANIPARYVLSHVLEDTERHREAYEEVLRVLELDGLHEDALSFAGYLAATLDDKEAARGHYQALLELDPTNAVVRMQVAYDLAQAGDVEGAMSLIKDGIELAPDNVDLLEMYGGYATRAAQDAMASAPPGAPLSMEAGTNFTEALGAYQRVYEIKGTEMDSRHLRNMLATLNHLEQLDEAVELAESILETHGDEAQFWSIYADILNKNDDLDGALTALDELAARDPAYANLNARRGMWILEAGRDEEAAPFLEEAIQAGELQPGQVVNIYFNNGYTKGVQLDEWAHAIRVLGRARAFGELVPEGLSGRTDFWYGYAIFKEAEIQEKPETVASAELTLPKFKQVQQILGQANVAAYIELQPSLRTNLAEVRGATEQFIIRQERVIERGRRR